MFSLNDDDVETIRRKSPRRGRIIAKLLEKPKRLLATLTVANTFINISFIAVFFGLGPQIFGSALPGWAAFVLQLSTTTFFILIFGEVIPKVYASRNSVLFAIRMADVLRVLDLLLAPISVPLREFSIAMNKKFGAKAEHLSVDRLSQALELTDYGDADAGEQRLLEGIVTFGSTEARQVMTPRIDIFGIEQEERYQSLLFKIRNKGFSRIPVYQGNIDRVTGVLFIKDLIPHLDKVEYNWQTLIRPPFYVPESKKLDDLLREFQNMKNHLAIVVDEHGATAGIISLEDILEEIVGDISDEFDDGDIIYSCIDEQNYLFDGKIGLRDFYRITGVDDEPFEQAKGEAESLGGFVMELADDFPVKGEKIYFNGNIFTVETVDRGRIRQIKFTLLNETN